MTERPPDHPSPLPQSPLAALFLGFILLMGCFWFTASIISLLLPGVTELDPLLASPEGRMKLRLVQTLSNLLSWGLAALIWARLQGPDALVRLRLHTGTRVSIYLITAGIMLCVLPMVPFFMIPEDALSLPESLKGVETWMRETDARSERFILGLIADEGAGIFLLNAFMIAAVPAVAEELFFRGFLQPTLRRLMPLHAAVWLCAFLFSFLHFQFLGFFARIFLGALLGYLAAWSGSLRLSILGHFLYNFLGLVLITGVQRGWLPAHWNDSDYRISPLIALPAASLCLFLTYTLYRLCQKHHPESDTYE